MAVERGEPFLLLQSQLLIPHQLSSASISIHMATSWVGYQQIQLRKFSSFISTRGRNGCELLGTREKCDCLFLIFARLK